MPHAPIAILETGTFVSQAEDLLSNADREALINVIAANPVCGNIIPGTGGVRKIRFALPGRGKSGGVRVIYFYHSDAMPLHLLAVFSKNKKANLTKAECNEFRKLTAALTRVWKKGTEK